MKTTYIIALFFIPFIYWNNFYYPEKFKQDIQIDKIEIFKKNRTLRICQKEQDGFKILREYKISLGRNPLGSKEQQGDNKTPEGSYVITRRNSNSSFYLSLEISYPNEKDKYRAKIKRIHPGNNIMIHGILNGLGWIGKIHLLRDWTKGCIAITNTEIKEIFDATIVGTPVMIYP